MRRFRVAANWKMHKVLADVPDFFTSFLAEYDVTRTDRDVIFFPSSILLPAVQVALTGKSGLFWGAQNVHWEAQGAFTGENSISQCLSVGCQYALVGHSERRTLFFESSEAVGRKTQALLKQKIVPMICIGETLKEREDGQTEQILLDQLQAALKDVQIGAPNALVVAYEPVWAIGTGKVATVEQAQDAHAFVRKTLGDLLGSNGKEVSVLYGGSVKAANAAELAQAPDIDGFLVGGASLTPTEFAAICSV